VPDFVPIAVPEAADAAAVAVRLPFRIVDAPIGPERGGELIAMRAASLRKVVVAGKLQANLAQTHAILLNGTVPCDKVPANRQVSALSSIKP
jgi:hypothetical protein